MYRGFRHPTHGAQLVQIFIWRYMAPAILFGRSTDVKMTMLHEKTDVK